MPDVLERTDDDSGSMFGELEGMPPTDFVPSAGDEGHFSFEWARHQGISVSVFCWLYKSMGEGC